MWFDIDLGGQWLTSGNEVRNNLKSDVDQY